MPLAGAARVAMEAWVDRIGPDGPLSDETRAVLRPGVVANDVPIVATRPLDRIIPLPGLRTFAISVRRPE